MRSAGRHARRDEHAAGAFGEALGAPKTSHRAEAGAAAKPKTDGWRQAGHGFSAERQRATARHRRRPCSKDNHRRQADARPGGIARRARCSLGQSDPAEADADDGMPTRMRAEQAISAIMTIAPITRQSAASAITRQNRRQGGRGRCRNRPVEGREQPRLAARSGRSSHPSQATRHASSAASRPQASRRRHSADAVTASTASATPGQGAKAAPARRRTRRMPQASAGRQADAAAAAPVEGKPKVRSPARTAATPGRRVGRPQHVARGTARRASGRRQGLGDRRAGRTGAGRSARSAPMARRSSTPSAPTQAGAPPPIRRPHRSRRAQTTPQPMRELKIQLHPLELGVVTAHLRTVGEKLSVELKVDNHDAYHRLERRQRRHRQVVARRSVSRSTAFRSSNHRQQRRRSRAPRRAPAPARSRATRRPSSPAIRAAAASASAGKRADGESAVTAQGNETAQPLNRDRAGSSLYI